MIRQGLIYLAELFCMFAEAVEREKSISSSRGFYSGSIDPPLVIGFQPFVDIVVNESGLDRPWAAGVG